MHWLIIAIMSLLLGHIVKVYRWCLFIESYEKPKVNVLLKSLSVAHAINFLIPFHVGDIYRIWYSGKKMANGIKFSFATIIVEHYIDLIVLALICLVLYAMGHNTMGMMVLVATFAATIVLLTIVTMRWDNITKNIILWLAEIFNPRIELNLLGLIWTFVSIFKKLISSISKTRVFFSTGLMWMLYMFSYWCFAESLQSNGVQIRLRDVVDIFFNRSSVIGDQLYEYGGNMLTIVAFISAYALIPLLLIYFASFLYDRKKTNATEQSTIRGSVIPHVNSYDALAFLETFFKGNMGGAYLKGFLEVNRDVSILEDYSAGSNAVTLLCTNGIRTFYRKFAIGTDGDKLYQQILWLQDHEQIIPLPQIIEVKKETAYCSYDMEYHEDALNFFTYIHTHTIDCSWHILENTLDDLRCSLYHFEKSASSSIVREYVEKKVLSNILLIKKSPLLSDILRYEDIYINGIRYDNLCKFEPCFNPDSLLEVFLDSPVSDIHGDLTIENIICYKDGYYLIDPNTGNILDCPYLDMGKLFQSLHGGYEFLMRVHDVSVKGNQIDFTYMRSSVYDALYQRLCQYIVDTYGEQVLKQVYYHELIHWLRLMPYKFSHLGDKAIIFYAGMMIVLNDMYKNGYL